jgi:hypothetical protein
VNFAPEFVAPVSRGRKRATVRPARPKPSQPTTAPHNDRAFDTQVSLQGVCVCAARAERPVPAAAWRGGQTRLLSAEPDLGALGPGDRCVGQANALGLPSVQVRRPGAAPHRPAEGSAS